MLQSPTNLSCLFLPFRAPCLSKPVCFARFARDYEQRMTTLARKVWATVGSSLQPKLSASCKRIHLCGLVLVVV